MPFSLSTIRIFKIQGSVSSVDEDSLQAALIPADIGGVARLDGFTSWSDNIDTSVVSSNGVILLRHGRATKTLAKGELKSAVDERVANGAVPSTRLNSDTQERLLRDLKQSVTSYPILIDPVSGLALFGSASEAQVNAARMQLHAVAPDLKLTALSANNVSNLLCCWMEGSLPLPAGIAFGRNAVLTNPVNQSATLFRDQELPNDVVLEQIARHGRIVTKLSLEWAGAMAFTVEDPMTLSGVGPSPALKRKLNSVKEPTERATLEKELAIWLEHLRPLLTCVTAEFESKPYVAPAATEATLPWIFNGRAA